MAELFRMRLLGYPELSLGGLPLAFRRRKTVALLVYLVLENRPIARETLAHFFADATSERLARHSLRASVAELREQLPSHFVVSRQAIAFNNSARHWVDVQEFQRRLAAADRGSQSLLAHATELYAGDLLAGFTLRHAPDFDAWLTAERLRLRDLAARAWHEQLDAAIAAGDPASCIAVAHRLLDANPSAEVTYRKAMALLAAHGEHDQALQLYERCRAALAARLEVAPLPETTALYERIRGERGMPARAQPPLFDAGAWARSDVALLLDRLASPECRLVTLLAPTPAAATALALRAVTHLLASGAALHPHPFPDGVYITSPEQALGSSPLADSLGQPLSQACAGATPAALPAIEKLLERIGASTLLLVLDGLTPTESEVTLVAGILRRAPAVTLLVVARERLFLQEEWVLDVDEAGIH
jgi:DNA-binding SARP family transcriptional activator